MSNPIFPSLLYRIYNYNKTSNDTKASGALVAVILKNMKYTHTHMHACTHKIEKIKPGEHECIFAGYNCKTVHPNLHYQNVI